MIRVRPFAVLAAFLIACLAARPSSGRDLAGIPWKEFKQRSDLVFEGILVKAEILDSDIGRVKKIRYVYKVYTVFKGDAGKTVTFDAPAEEDINKTVGRIAIVALRKVNEDKQQDTWTLSVDERSCWPHANKMGKRFGGVPVFKIPRTLLYDLPAELAEEVEIRGPKDVLEKTTVYPMKRVEEKLKSLLAN